MALRGPVVAAIDLTDAADDVLAQAGAIAASLDTRLVVCHVLHETLRVRMLFPQFAGLDAPAQAAIEARAREVIAARVHAVTRRAAADVDLAFETGSPHAGILMVVDRVGAGLLVMGPGAVADRVARFVPCPVLVARRSPPGSVLGATDFSDPSLPALDAAVAEARRRRVPVRLLNSLEFSEPVTLGSVYLGVLPELPAHLIAEIERDSRKRLEDILARHKTRGEAIVAHGPAAAAIVKAAHDAPAELIVIGIRGRSNLSRLLLGSVAETVLRTAPCSVLLVHLKH